MSKELLSVFIPLAVLLLAALTKKIIPSLIVGLLLGGILLARGNIIEGIISAVDHLVRAGADKESFTILLFIFFFGALAQMMEVSGGIRGFKVMMDKKVNSERSALLSIWYLTPFTFIDCCFHSIATGTVAKSLIDKVHGNRYRLAHVLNVTSSLLIVLIPFGTTYVGYIVGVIGLSLRKVGITAHAYSLFLKSIPFNFYAIVMVLISLIVLFSNRGFNKPSLSPQDIQREEVPHMHEAHEQCEFEEKAPPRPMNLIIPLLLLTLSTFFFFWYTGRNSAPTFWGALMHADFEASILLSGVCTTVVTSIFYLPQKIPLWALESHFLKGGGEMLPPILVLLLSWALSSIVQDLGFVPFIRSVIGFGMPAQYLPAVVFLIACAASYFMGSAWGTWALLMPVALPLAVSTGCSVPLMIGAVLAGGSLGDNASPLGETAILCSTLSDIPLLAHIKTQLPYSLLGIFLSTVLFLIAGIVF